MAGGAQGAKGPQAGASSFGGPSFQQVQMQPSNMNWGGMTSPSVMPQGYGGAPSVPMPPAPASMPPSYGGMASPAFMPQMPQGVPNFATGAPDAQQMQAAFNPASPAPSVQAPLPPAPAIGPAAAPTSPSPALAAQFRDPRFQQNPTLSPRVSDLMPSVGKARNQVQGNPNATPVQRSASFSPRRNG